MDQNELIDRLFRAVAPYIEDAFDAAIATGAAEERTDEHTKARVRRLQAAGRGLGAIAGAIEAILPLPATEGPK